MLAAIYARVSTADQADQKRFGIPAQLEACRQYAKSHSMVVLEEYIDEISGTEAVRPAFEKLLREASTYSAVVMYSQDRLARDVEVSYALLKALQRYGLEVHSTQRGKMERGLVFGIEALMGEEERKRIVERTVRGRYQRARSGKLPIGLRTYGYHYDKNTGQATISEEEAAIVRRIFQEAASSSVAAIVRTLNREGVPAPGNGGHGGAKWWQPTIGDMLKTPTYKGEYVYGGNGEPPVVVPVPAIVSFEEWEKAQKPPMDRKRRTGNPLVGHLRCGVCGLAMNSHVTGKNRVYQYRCGSSGPTYDYCGNSAIACHLLDPAVEKELRRIVGRQEYFEAALVQEISPASHEALAMLHSEDERWLLAYQKGAISADELAGYRRDIKERRRALSRPKRRVINYRAIKSKVVELGFKELLEALRVKVVWERGNFDISLDL